MTACSFEGTDLVQVVVDEQSGADVSGSEALESDPAEVHFVDRAFVCRQHHRVEESA